MTRRRGRRTDATRRGRHAECIRSRLARQADHGEGRKEGQITREGDRHPTPQHRASFPRSLVHLAGNSWGRSIEETTVGGSEPGGCDAEWRMELTRTMGNLEGVKGRENSWAKCHRICCEGIARFYMLFLMSCDKKIDGRLRHQLPTPLPLVNARRQKWRTGRTAHSEKEAEAESALSERAWGFRGYVIMPAIE